jgi:hypothetical protein
MPVLPIQKVPVQMRPIRKVPVQKVPVQRASIQKAHIKKVPFKRLPIQKGPIQKVSQLAMDIPPSEAECVIDFARRLQNAMNQLGEPASLETVAPEMNLATSLRFIQTAHATVQSRRLSFTYLAYAMHVRGNTLHKQFARVGYRVDVKRGPLPIISLDEVRQRIQALHEVEDIRCGDKRTTESIADPNEAPP